MESTGDGNIPPEGGASPEQYVFVGSTLFYLLIFAIFFGLGRSYPHIKAFMQELISEKTGGNVGSALKELAN